MSSGAGFGVPLRRYLKFSLAGAAGFAVQLGILAALTACGVHYLVGTTIAVEAAILQNFIWHQNFTWADRREVPFTVALSRLARFNLTTGSISLVGNLILMRVLAGELRLPV